MTYDSKEYNTFFFFFLMVHVIFHDCPHREKLGWLEVHHLMAKSIGYNFDISRLFSKTIRDYYEAQLLDGFIPNIAPEYLYKNHIIYILIII